MLNFNDLVCRVSTTERAKQLQQAIQVHNKKQIHKCMLVKELRQAHLCSSLQLQHSCRAGRASVLWRCRISLPHLRRRLPFAPCCRRVQPMRTPLTSFTAALRSAAAAAAPPDSPPPSCEPLPPSSFFLSNAATFLMELDLDGEGHDWGR